MPSVGSLPFAAEGDAAAPPPSPGGASQAVHTAVYTVSQAARRPAFPNVAALVAREEVSSHVRAAHVDCRPARWP